MLFVVEPEGAEKVINIAKKYEIPVSVIGETTETGMYRLFWHGKEVASLPPEILAEAPRYTLNDNEPQYISEYRNLSLDKKTSINEVVEKIVSDPNFASKRWVYRQYDHTVGTRTSLRPAQSGAAGIWIYEEGGVAGLAIDSNGRQVFLNPYEGAKNSVWECCRNLISSGFKPLGVTDCLNYGNPEKDEVAYQFVKSVEGIADACREAEVPVVSGNVSFYNESPERRVFPTPTIGMVGYADSPDKLLKVAFATGETVILLGNQINDDSNIGGSLYQRSLYDFIGGEVYKTDSALEIKLEEVIFALRDNNFIGGCIDVSEGGLFGAVFEGINNGNTGFKGNLIFCKDAEKALFGEITGRYVISTPEPEKTEKMLQSKQIQYKIIGSCVDNVLEFDGYSFDCKKLYDMYDKSIELEMER
jgi:phosphoribosylformylglycinamidine synthase